MSDGEWFLILCIVCAAAFYFGGVFGAYKQGKMYREKLNNCQNAIRKELSGVTSRDIFWKSKGTTTDTMRAFTEDLHIAFIGLKGYRK